MLTLSRYSAILKSFLIGISYRYFNRIKGLTDEKHNKHRMYTRQTECDISYKTPMFMDFIQPVASLIISYKPIVH